jgi:hypothetical protein
MTATAAFVAACCFAGGPCVLVLGAVRSRRAVGCMSVQLSYSSGKTPTVDREFAVSSCVTSITKVRQVYGDSISGGRPPQRHGAFARQAVIDCARVQAVIDCARVMVDGLVRSSDGFVRSVMVRRWASQSVSRAGRLGDLVLERARPLAIRGAGRVPRWREVAAGAFARRSRVRGQQRGAIVSREVLQCSW